MNLKPVSGPSFKAAPTAKSLREIGGTAKNAPAAKNELMEQKYDMACRLTAYYKDAYEKLAGNGKNAKKLNVIA